MSRKRSTKRGRPNKRTARRPSVPRGDVERPRLNEDAARAAPNEANPGVASARIMVNPAGFAFGERLDGEGSIFIAPPNRAGAMDGDEAVLAWWPGPRGAEGLSLIHI